MLRRSVQIPTLKSFTILPRSILEAVENAGNNTAAMAVGIIKSFVAASKGVA